MDWNNLLSVFMTVPGEAQFINYISWDSLLIRPVCFCLPGFFPSSLFTVMVFSNHIFHFIIFLKKQLLLSGCNESGVSGDCVIDLVVSLRMPWMRPLKSINPRKLQQGLVNPGFHIYPGCLSYFWAKPLRWWWWCFGWFEHPESLVFLCLVTLVSLTWMQNHQIYSLLYFVD